ncbi:nucleoside-diphosphate kinase [Desulfurispira natronophila]|uniref:Nucleoside diphosphate kinase n=1 Tax=Desulfurispira natronophila TaxID=682562 RepID=A0A7W7Y615_9BACT|nr:nucleoside-diphosphate kinase [Desulfurispira natronophila]MBB5022766.1 nucleoside-diphosphate kinase [Desulfurispira natronophila]
MNQTFAMIKPDAVERGLTGKIINRIEEAGFTIVAMKKVQLSLQDAQNFYAVHKERPFFGELTQFMSRSPIVALVLQKDNAYSAWRDLMGATNPTEAADGTIRKEFGQSIGENATHGSDSEENAIAEISFFFSQFEINR